MTKVTSHTYYDHLFIHSAEKKSFVFSLGLSLKKGCCGNFCACVHFVCVYMLSRFCCVLLFVTLWTAALQAPLSMGFSRQQYWSALSCPYPGNLPNPGIESTVSYVSHIGRRVLYHQHHLTYTLVDLGGTPRSGIADS